MDEAGREPGAPRGGERTPGAPGTAGLPPGRPFEETSTFLGLHCRGYLPHRDDAGLLQFVTFRLGDSLPARALSTIEADLLFIPEDRRPPERRKRLQELLDAHHGCCVLRHPEMATVLEETLHHAEGERYALLSWCIMPNHVHVLLEPRVSLATIVRTWKSYTARWAMENKDRLGLRLAGDRLWMRDYWDRFIRNERHRRMTVDYIHENPVKAGLCASADQWRWSSAWRG